MMDEFKMPPRQRLPYEVTSCSSFSSDFRPENILDERPRDISSRWSGIRTTRDVDDGDRPGRRVPDEPWIAIKLPGRCILLSITFGKYHEPHPCNPTSVRVLGGLTPDPAGMREIASSPLRNHSRPETLQVHTRDRMWTGEMATRRPVWDLGNHPGAVESDVLEDPSMAETPPREDLKGQICRTRSRPDGKGQDMLFPVEYIRILPGPAYESRFNTSIWHVTCHGIMPSPGVELFHSQHQRFRNLHTNRLMLKHLRENRTTAAFDALLLSTSESAPGEVLEHPSLTSLHTSMVVEGDFDEAERIVGEMFTKGLMDRYITERPGGFAWKDVRADMEGDRPGRRGGHAMCVTEGDGWTYLFGGWDGEQELDDFWSRTPLDSFVGVGPDAVMMGMEGGDGSSQGPWKRIQRTRNDALWPPPTNGHTMTTDGSKLYMMGARSPFLGGKIAPPDQAASDADGSVTPTVIAPDADMLSMEGGSARHGDGYGLVASDLMEVVEVAKKAATREAKAHVLWSYDIPLGEWEILSDGRDIPYEGKDALEIRSICHMIDPATKSPVILVWGHLEEDPDAGGGSMYAFNLETKIWVKVDSGASGLPEASICIPVPEEAQVMMLRPMRRLDGNVMPTILQWALSHKSVIRTFDSETAPGIEMSPRDGYRAFVDIPREELVVIFGHSRGCILPQEGKKGAIWRFSFRLRKWLQLTDRTKIPQLADAGPLRDSDEDQRTIGYGRAGRNFDAQMCGHQLVRDHRRGTVYLVGGRTGDVSPGQNEFKRLVLDRYDPLDVKRECLKLVRKQRFLEMAGSQPLQVSLAYLQTAVREVYQDRDDAERRELRQMSSFMLRGGPGLAGKGTASGETSETVYAERHAVFRGILGYIDERYKEPAEDLVHLTTN